MPVIHHETDEDEDIYRSPELPMPHPVVHAFNIALALTTLAALLGVAWILLPAPAGVAVSGPVALVCHVTLGLSVGASGILIMKQALERGRSLSLLVSLAGAACIAIGLAELGEHLTSAPVLTSLMQSRTVQLTAFFLSTYLLFWERGVRIQSGSDHMVDAVRALPQAWPVLIALAMLLGVEIYAG